jgi:glycosyltransferase involved in cell wall biosynthesis
MGDVRTAPLVSVLVTVHDRTAFLREALASVLAQTFTSYEVIVADDSGAAAARTLCEGLDRRVRYVANPRTLGVAQSLQGALQRSRGRYIAILNDDDRWEPEFLERLVRPLEADDRRVLAFSDHWIMSEQGTIDHAASERNTARYGRARLKGGDVPDAAHLVLLQNGVPLAMAAVFRKASFDQASLVPEVAGAYDFWIASQLAATGGRFYYVPARLTCYRVHPQMETARRSARKTECQVYIFRSLLERNDFAALRPYLQRRLSRATVAVGNDHLDFDQAREARRLFARAFRISWGWRPVAAYALSLVPLSVRRMIRAS